MKAIDALAPKCANLSPMEEVSGFDTLFLFTSNDYGIAFQHVHSEITYNGTNTTCGDDVGTPNVDDTVEYFFASGL